jgi:hypothetical protein
MLPAIFPRILLLQLIPQVPYQVFDTIVDHVVPGSPDGLLKIVVAIAVV